MSSASGATTARDAAVKILLEEIEPMLRRVEDTSTLLTQVRLELDRDLTTLGALVQRGTDAQATMTEGIKRLAGTAGRIEASITAPMIDSTQAKAANTRPGTAIVATCLGSATLAALMVAGGFYLFAADTLEQARLGRALERAWPNLDPDTRQKVQSVLGK